MRTLTWAIMGIAFLGNAVSARADLILLSSSAYLIEYDDSTSASFAFDNLGTAFPQTGTLFAGNETGSFSQFDYAYSQSGGVSNLDWTVSQFQDGSFGANSEIEFIQYFKATANATYSWNADVNWQVSGSADYPYFESMFLFWDLTGGVPEFEEFDVENHSFFGNLIAGHEYMIATYTRIYENLTALSSTATGNFSLTVVSDVQPVPEPGSIAALVSLVACGSVVLIHRRRRVQRIGT